MKLGSMPRGISWPLVSLIALGVAGCSDGGGGDAGSAESASSAAGGSGGAGAVGASAGTGAGAGEGGGDGVTAGAGAGPGSSTTTGSTSSTSGGGGGEPSATSTGATTSTGTGSQPVSCDYPAEYANGSITFYTLDMGSTEVNCSYPIVGRNPDVVGHVPFGGGQYFAAMNTADYNAAAMCGACVEVSRDDGRKVQAMVVDQCPIGTNPKCKTGHIDLSKNAFLKIGEEREGYLGTTNGGAAGKISWRYIPCPTTGAVSFRLKEPTNVAWNQILVEGHAHPIEKLEVEINGTWKTATREPYNYFVVGDGNMGNAPYHVRATDINGSTVEAMLDLKAGNQPASGQFAACN
ncbi:expansin EXLX1 family cellulose-binding protein [Sorangium sp. So ce426]|uniref:expansin EXLX1 family cellulose-binding protein n=1 Tax=Sorangium sp. So ce426 TaxID=3133312 RepID=UPI003F5C6B46